MAKRPIPEALSEFIKALDYEDDRRPQDRTEAAAWERQELQRSKSLRRTEMSKRPIPERLEIIELCIKAVRRELLEDADYDDVTDYLESAEDVLCSARQAFREVRA